MPQTAGLALRYLLNQASPRQVQESIGEGGCELEAHHCQVNLLGHATGPDSACTLLQCSQASYISQLEATEYCDQAITCSDIHGVDAIRHKVGELPSLVASTPSPWSPHSNMFVHSRFV